MTVYLDTSSLAKAYIVEAGSDRVRELLASAAVVATSVVTYAEMRALFARLRREREMTPTEANAAVRQFELDWSSYLVIDVTDTIARSAGALADRLGLRGFDAIHLASFEVLAGRIGDDDLEFSSADVRLARAAARLG